MRSSNPVLGRLTDRSAQHATFRRAPAPAPKAEHGYGGYGGFGEPETTYAPYPTTPVADRMTLDDVVIRTIGMLGVVALTGALSWLLLPPTSPAAMPALFGAAITGVVLGLVISFARITNPAVILTYAAVEGVFLGLISQVFDRLYPGVVIQAIVGTLGLFFGMAALYKFKVIRATPTFVKWVMGAMIGVFSLMLVNLVAGVFGVNGGAGLGLRDGGAMAIIFSLVCITIASLTFVLDFKAIEDGIAYGAERKYAWYAAFGIVVGLIWLYLEILRLLGYLRGDD